MQSHAVEFLLDMISIRKPSYQSLLAFFIIICSMQICNTIKITLLFMNTFGKSIHHTSLRKTKITNISKIIHLSGMSQIRSIMTNHGTLLMKTFIFILIFLWLLNLLNAVDRMLPQTTKINCGSSLPFSWGNKHPIKIAGGEAIFPQENNSGCFYWGISTL